MRHVELEGLRFRVIESRHPADTPVFVLLHGIGVSHRYHARLHRRLAAASTVISIDLPGFAGLPKPLDDVDVATMASALAGLLHALRLGPVVLVGHSMGTQWAVETAVQRPDLVTNVVLIGPVTDDRRRTAMAQFRSLALDSLGELPWTNVMVYTDYVRCGIPWYLTQLRHMLAYRIEERVAEVRVPVLIIRGARDPIAREDWCRRLRQRAPASTLVRIPHGHHVVQRSAPGAVMSAILAHVTSTGRRPAA
ncbi:hydrolase [Pseudoclavibacter endophyticus]|uniref:alpha/beta fold hydrolase n=1 Tax=Pseudoclavibacter endophyticus TaxID=1778590 RepID=UPI0019B53B6D|nr:alpha/beta hydrolase [Pseudoclavibacter endophyticus]GGA58373.1 hydrolase [Pseudoclavibacter endophyticus]